jgi:diacylglycerol kinase family enzyme
MEIRIDEQALWQTPTLMFSVLVGRREGGFVMAPEARLDDGWFDFVHAGALSRWSVLRFLPRVALFGPPANHPQVRLGRCRNIQLRSEAPLIVHVDGEFFCRPEDRIQDLHIELLPAALRVQTSL